MSSLETRTEQAIETARIALLLGDVERATKHPCGKRETDTTHSLMLVWVACELARRLLEFHGFKEEPAQQISEIPV